jgi:type IV secretion system protein VirB6
VFDLLSRGPDQIAAALLGNSGGATHAFAERLDGIFDRFINLAQALESKGQSGQLAARWVWASTLLLMLCTAGLVLVVKVVMAVLLALGPLFIVFALFDGTRGLFEGWLKTSIAFALAPLLIVIGGVGAITILAPISDALLDDPAGLSTDLKPVFMLFMGTLIYAATLLALFWTAMSLVRHWRTPFSQMMTFHGSRLGASSTPTVAVGVTHHPRSDTSASDERIASLLVAVSKGHAPTAGATRPIATAVRPEASAQSGRTIGLGQTQRIKSHKRGFSGRIRA